MIPSLVQESVFLRHPEEYCWDFVSKVIHICLDGVALCGAWENLTRYSMFAGGYFEKQARCGKCLELFRGYW